MFSGGVSQSLFPTSADGLAFSDDGTLYVADTLNNSILKINRAGQVTTIAGSSGGSGSIDGVGTSAAFKRPSGIAVDGIGNVYVGDALNYTIRKITPDGVVSTLAGSAGLQGAADGKGAAARFMSVVDIAVDKSGAVIVAEPFNNAIRRVSPDGVVTTIGGVMPVRGSNDGAALTSRFNFPTGIARDNAGKIYLTDTNNYTIRKISPAGDTTTLAGESGKFAHPTSTAVDPLGNVYVADDFLIRRISGVGDVSIFANAELAIGLIRNIFPPFLRSVAFDSRSQLYAVADLNAVDGLDAKIYKASSNGSFTPISCGAGCTPLAVAGDAVGNIFVASRGAIRRIDVDGVATVLAGVESDGSRATFDWKDGSGTAARFSTDLNALAIDNNGNIFVCDTGNHIVRKITPSGVVTTAAGKAGIAGTTLGPLPGLLNAPKGIILDNAGNLYVTTEDAVVKITLS